MSFFRISAEGPKGPRPRRISEPSGDEEDLALLTPEERERRKSFEQKRKAHYNEFYAVKMARQLMEQEQDDENGDASGAADAAPSASGSGQAQPQDQSSSPASKSSPMDTASS